MAVKAGRRAKKVGKKAVGMAKRKPKTAMALGVTGGYGAGRAAQKRKEARKRTKTANKGWKTRRG